MQIKVEDHPVKLTKGRGKSNSIRIFKPNTEKLRIGNELHCLFIGGDQSFDPLFERKFSNVDEFTSFITSSLHGQQSDVSDDVHVVSDELETLEPGYKFEGLGDVLSGCANEFVEQFKRDPFRHRVEHSVHCDLFRILDDALSDVRIKLSNGLTTGLVHKEWPEPRLYKDRTRRGSIDLAVLPPTEDEIDIEIFKAGRIKPVAGFELSLNYGMQHFDKDIKTLENAMLDHSYVIHLANSAEGQEEVFERGKTLAKQSNPSIVVAIVDKAAC